MNFLGKCGVCGRDIGVADDIEDRCRSCGATISSQVRPIETYPGALKDFPPTFTEDVDQ